MCTTCDERPVRHGRRCDRCAHDSTPPSPLPPPDRQRTGLDWHRDAACRGMGPDVFYPVNPGSKLEGRWARDRALAVCLTCPVTHDCLAYALDVGEEYGIWGATTPDDRKALQRIRQRHKHQEAG